MVTRNQDGTHPQWQDAMYDEYNALIKNGTRVLVPKSHGANILDVKNVFLNGDLLETVYMPQPLGFVDPRYSHHVCRLHSKCDSSLFIYISGTDTSFLLIDVDDIVLTASSTALLQKIILSLHREFDMTDLGALNYLLGISVTRDSGLQYLTFTRLDLSYDVQPSCLYMHDPREPHLAALKRILHYVRGTLEFVCYHGLQRENPLFYAIVLKLNIGDVANVVAETAWLHNLLQELHTPPMSATLVYSDNVSAVYLSANSLQHQLTKHIEIDIPFVRDMVAMAHIRVLHVSSRYQYADIFTKGLPAALFEKFRTSLSVRSPPAQTVWEC
ncbi:ribonuclease H-like domain-containing protein [Tanacetum coccineum]